VDDEIRSRDEQVVAGRGGAHNAEHVLAEAERITCSIGVRRRCRREVPPPGSTESVTPRYRCVPQTPCSGIASAMLSGSPVVCLVEDPLRLFVRGRHRRDRAFVERRLGVLVGFGAGARGASAWSAATASRSRAALIARCSRSSSTARGGNSVKYSARWIPRASRSRYSIVSRFLPAHRMMPSGGAPTAYVRNVRASEDTARSGPSRPA